MIVMRIKGGLGNQLFQYAAAYALSKRLTQPFCFDPSFTGNMTARGYKLPQLCVASDEIIAADHLSSKIKGLKNKYVNKCCRLLNLSVHGCGNYLYWLETRDRWQPAFFTINNGNLYVDGYFQTEAYFKTFRQELLSQFSPRYEPEPAYLEALKEIKSCAAVAVHVRRGDFKKDNCAFHYLLDEGYYKNAIAEIKKHVAHPVFFWFSDDEAWVRQHVGDMPESRFIRLETAHGDIDEMMLMKNCRHIIAANSTFSWWAAWLNEHESALKIVPERPYGMKDMIPDGWIKIKE